MTSAVEDTPEEFLKYLKIGAQNLDLRLLDAKGFRILNRLCLYMKQNNITKFSAAFPGMVVTDTNRKGPVIKIDDFYYRLKQLGIRRQHEQDCVLNLSKFLDREKLCRYICNHKLSAYVEAYMNGNPYILSFGTKRRRMPNAREGDPLYRNVEFKKN